jgi:glutamate/tyrosine decarboxylase-like PLP-dependent enzyme
MVMLGVEGYKKHADDILKVTKTIALGVQKIAGLRLLGKAEAMIVCFAGTEVQGKPVCIYAIGDVMTRLGWSLNTVTMTQPGHILIDIRI